MEGLRRRGRATSDAAAPGPRAARMALHPMPVARFQPKGKDKTVRAAVIAPHTQSPGPDSDSSPAGSPECRMHYPHAPSATVKAMRLISEHAPPAGAPDAAPSASRVAGLFSGVLDFLREAITIITDPKSDDLQSPSSSVCVRGSHAVNSAAPAPPETPNPSTRKRKRPPKDPRRESRAPMLTPLHGRLVEKLEMGRVAEAASPHGPVAESALDAAVPMDAAVPDAAVRSEGATGPTVLGLAVCVSRMHQHTPLFVTSRLTHRRPTQLRAPVAATRFASSISAAP